MLRIATSLAAAVLAICASAAQAGIKTEWVEYGHDNVKRKGYLAYDDTIAGKRRARATAGRYLKEVFAGA